jgi:hypothetical protein
MSKLSAEIKGAIDRAVMTQEDFLEFLRLLTLPVRFLAYTSGMWAGPLFLWSRETISKWLVSQ